MLELLYFCSLIANRKTCTDTLDKLLIISRKKDIRVRQLHSKNPLDEHDMVGFADGTNNFIESLMPFLFSTCPTGDSH